MHTRTRARTSCEQGRVRQFRKHAIRRRWLRHCAVGRGAALADHEGNQALSGLEGLALGEHFQAQQLKCEQELLVRESATSLGLRLCV